MTQTGGVSPMEASKKKMAENSPGRMLEIAGLAAQIILENGAETYRVEDTVLRLCGSYGFHDADVIALSTGVIISVTVPEGSSSIIRRVRKRGMHLSRVNAVNDLSREIAGGGVGMEQAMRALQAIAAQPGAPMWRMSLMTALVAGSFALMFGGGWQPFLVACVCGFITRIMLVKVQRADSALVLVALFGGMICAAVTMAAFYLLRLTPQSVETALAGAIMPLISGLMMTNAVRDTLRGDLLSGIARSLEALLVAVMVALGISLILRFYLPGNNGVTVTAPGWYLSVLYAGIATMFFCPLLHVPRRAVPVASLLGAASCGAYLLMLALGSGEVFALFAASAAVAILCDVLARRMRMIATIFMCAALIPLVPGLGLYRTMRLLLQGEPASGLAQGLHTLLAVGAIALGAAIGSMRIRRKP